VEVCEPFDLSFGVVSGVGRGMGVLDGRMRAKRGRPVLGGFSPHWFQRRIHLTEMHSTSA